MGLEVVNQLIKRDHRSGPNNRALSGTLVLCARPGAALTNALVALDIDQLARFVPLVLVETWALVAFDALTIVFHQAIGTDTRGETVARAV